jgi:hypothetical protein
VEDKELREIYADACAAKGYDTDGAQYKTWKEPLLWCDKRDVETALARWWETETQLPMPSQLKPLVDMARKARIARSTQEQWLVGWRCPSPDHYFSMCGFVADSDRRTRYCRICNGPMKEFERQRSSEAVA